MTNFFVGVIFGIAGMILGQLIYEAMEEKKEARERKKALRAEMEIAPWRCVHKRIDLLRHDLDNASRGVAILTARADGQLKYVDACMEKHEEYSHAPKKESKKK